MKKHSFLFTLFVGLFSLSLLFACRKKEDTIAIIHVRNSANEAVSMARVVLYGQSTTGQASSVTIYDTTFTDASGDATFNYNEVYQLGQAGVAVLNIQASKDGAIGQGIIKVEQETTSEETVFIQ